MYILVKKDIQANHWSVYVGTFSFVLLTYLVTLPATLVLFLSVFAITFSAFSYDDTVSANRYLLSMPIVRKDIVKARYLFGIVITTGILMGQFVIMKVMQYFFHTTLYVYHWQDMLALFGITLCMIAVFIPVIYFFNSVANAMFVIFALVGLTTIIMMNELEKVLPFTDAIIFNDVDPGFRLLMERYFPYPAYLFLIIFTGLILYASVLLSVYLFKRKDF